MVGFPQLPRKNRAKVGLAASDEGNDSDDSAEIVDVVPRRAILPRLEGSISSTRPSAATTRLRTAPSTTAHIRRAAPSAATRLRRPASLSTTALKYRTTIPSSCAAGTRLRQHGTSPGPSSSTCASSRTTKPCRSRVQTNTGTSASAPPALQGQPASPVVIDLTAPTPSIVDVTTTPSAPAVINLNGVPASTVQLLRAIIPPLDECEGTPPLPYYHHVDFDIGVHAREFLGMHRICWACNVLVTARWASTHVCDFTHL